MQKLFLIIVIASKLLILEHNWVLRIGIILPPPLIPYYEWFIDFPGWQPNLEKQNPIEIRTEYGIINYHL